MYHQNQINKSSPDHIFILNLNNKCYLQVVTRVTCTQPENETQTNISGGSSLSESGTSRLYNDWSAVVKIKNTQSDITVEEKFFGHNAPARVRCASLHHLLHVETSFGLASGRASTELLIPA